MMHKTNISRIILVICALMVSMKVAALDADWGSALFGDMPSPTGLNKVYFVPKDKVDQRYDYVQAIVEKKSTLADGSQIRVRYMIKNDTDELQFRVALDCSPSARRQFAKLEPENDKKTGKCNVSIKLHDGSKLDFNNVTYIYIKTSDNGCAIAPVIEIDNNTMPKLVKLKESDMKSVALYKNGSLVGQEIAVDAHNSTTLDDMLEGFSKRVNVDPRLMFKSNVLTEARIIQKCKETPTLMEFEHPFTRHVMLKDVQWARDWFIGDVHCTMYYTNTAGTRDPLAVTDIYFVPESYVPMVRNGKEITCPPKVEKFILHVDGEEQFFGAWISLIAMKENGELCKIQMEHRLDEVLGDRVFYLLAGETKYHAQPLRNSMERVKTVTLKSPVITNL